MLGMFGFLTDELRNGTNILAPQICSLHTTRLMLGYKRNVAYAEMFVDLRPL